MAEISELKTGTKVMLDGYEATILDVYYHIRWTKSRKKQLLDDDEVKRMVIKKEKPFDVEEHYKRVFGITITKSDFI